MAKIHSTINIPVALASKGGALEGFVWDNMIRGHKPTFSDDVVTLNGTNPNEQPTFADLVSIVTNGGSFEGVKLALRFTSAASAQRVVPEVVRGSRYVDEEGVTQERTWIDWFRVNSGIKVITDGTSYASKAAYAGILLNSEELAAANAQSGVNVIEWAEAVALFQDENWTEYEL